MVMKFIPVLHPLNIFQKCFQIQPDKRKVIQISSFNVQASGAATATTGLNLELSIYLTFSVISIFCLSWFMSCKK